MTGTPDLPLWAALLVAFFMVGGCGLALIGALGVLRLKSFYERVHAPTLGSTWGAGGVLIASMIYFSVLQSRLALHEILIAIFLFVTTPVTLTMLVRAALYRDRSEEVRDVPTLEAVAGNAGEQQPSQR